MDDLTAFISARLDEDEAAAYALSGTTWTAKRLGDHDYEIHVIHDPLIHAVAPTSGIADVQREDVANWIAHHDPRRAQREIEAKRKVLEWYADSVDASNLFREKLGTGTHMATAAESYLNVMRVMAAAWSDHPDYQQGWAT